LNIELLVKGGTPTKEEKGNNISIQPNINLNFNPNLNISKIENSNTFNIQYVSKHRASHKTIHTTHSRCVNNDQCRETRKKRNR
jgi:hypothetical protein